VPSSHLEQAALIGLWDATRDWDESKGASFYQHSMRKMLWGIQDYLRSLDILTKHFRRETKIKILSLDKPSHDDEDDENLHNKMGVIEPEYRGVIGLNRFRNYFYRLTPAHRKILIDIYWKQKPLLDIAPELGVTASRITQAHQWILASLHKAITQNNFNTEFRAAVKYSKYKPRRIREEPKPKRGKYKHNILPVLGEEEMSSSKLLKVQELADHLQCSRHSIYRLVERGKIPAMRLGLSSNGAIRFKLEDVEEWLRKKSIERMKNEDEEGKEDKS
jgi:excisionase family DNA binding protein